MIFIDSTLNQDEHNLKFFILITRSECGALPLGKYFTESKISKTHCLKIVRIRSYSGPHFPAFGLNTERYRVSLCTQFECGKMRTRITPNTDTSYAVTAIIGTKITLLIVFSVIPCSFGT